MEKFFISTPPGFEKLVIQEMRQAWPHLVTQDKTPNNHVFPEIKVTKGGLEFEADLALAVQFNVFLKIANRILLRVDSFRARDFSHLFNKARKRPWGNWLRQGPLEVHASASQSRLGNEKRIIETLREALRDFDEHQNLPAAKWEINQSVFVRAEKDLFELSVDTSGEHLHKRGFRTYVGVAPLRETLAAGILKFLLTGLSDEEINKFTLFDPMAGAGTFVLEAATLFAPLAKRRFAFENFKVTPAWVNNAIGSIRARKLKASDGVRSAFRKFVGMDEDTGVLEALKKNVSSICLEMNDLGSMKGENIDVEALQGSFWEFTTGELKAKLGDQLFVVVNPPYGKRIKVEDPDYFEKLVDRISELDPKRTAMILPRGQTIQTRKSVRKLDFENGGIPVTCWVIG